LSDDVWSQQINARHGCEVHWNGTLLVQSFLPCMMQVALLASCENIYYFSINTFSSIVVSAAERILPMRVARPIEFV